MVGDTNQQLLERWIMEWRNTDKYHIWTEKKNYITTRWSYSSATLNITCWFL